MSRNALTMLAKLSDLPAHHALPSGPYTLRPITPGDTDALLELTLAAFHGTPDAQPEPETARDLTRCLDGETAGPLDAAASLAAVTGEPGTSIAAATIVTHYKTRPLLAYVMTHPDHRGTGLGAALITASGAALANTGHTELALAVTRGNPAIALYKRLGFEEWTPPRDDNAGSDERAT